MVTFFTATLVISMVGLVLLIGVKRWEMTTGRVVWASVRPAVGEALHRVVLFFERVLPGLLRAGVTRAIAGVRAFAHRAAAWGVLILERVLESVLHGLRRKTSVRHVRREQSSDFLREVAEHKKKIQELEDRAIYED